LGLEPFVMAFRPRLFRSGEAPPMAEEEVREAMAGAQQIGADVFATAEEIAHGLFLIGGDVNRGEGAGTIQHGELAGVASIRFHAIPGAARDQ